MDDVIAPITQALGGGAALTVIGYIVYAIWRAWTKHEENKTLEEKAEAQSLDAGFSRLLAASERQDAEIHRLSERSAEDRLRIERLEESNRELADENRTFRVLLGALIEGLRRKPPDDPDTLLDLILSKVPSLGLNHHKE